MNKYEPKGIEFNDYIEFRNNQAIFATSVSSNGLSSAEKLG